MAQVVKLCRKHRLYSALIYILTRGLDDFVAPAVELLLALADTAKTPALAGAAGADEQATAAHAAGFKLLVYLRCCLRQQGFPPGAGPLPPGKASIVKAGMLGALMFTVSNFKLQLAQCPGAHSCTRVQLHWHATQQLKQLQTAAFSPLRLPAGLLLYATPETMLRMWRSLGGGLTSISPEQLDQALPGLPFAAARSLGSCACLTVGKCSHGTLAGSLA